jgi:hypothetical protein
MRSPVENNRGAKGFPNGGEGLGGWSARGNLIKDRVELRIHRLEASDANRSAGKRQCCAVTQFDGYRMREMADPAVLVLEGIAVPVAGGLDGKGHNQESHKSGKDAARYPRL